MTAPDRATPQATAALAAQRQGAGFYRPGWDQLQVASIGLGTYLGEPDAATDEGYTNAARRYLALGGDLLDTAINYRFQRSERVLGAVLQAAIAAGETRRAEVVVCTKGGYVPFDGQWPADPEGWIRSTYIETGLAEPDEIVAGHCLAPAFLRHSLEQSRTNLQVGCVDMYYLHNPEGQRAVVGDEVFRGRLREAFATLEVAVSQGLIGAYGVATWNGFRVQPDAPEYLSLENVLAVARDVAGNQHHFRAIQLPVNLRMLEAVGRSNQPGPHGQAPLLQVAAEHGLTVVGSASLMQGRLAGRLPDRLRAKFDPSLTDAQRALQFVRSAPGLAAALAGMSQVEHVNENLALLAIPPMDTPAWRAVFQS